MNGPLLKRDIFPLNMKRKTIFIFLALTLLVININVALLLFGTSFSPHDVITPEYREIVKSSEGVYSDISETTLFEDLVVGKDQEAVYVNKQSKKRSGSKQFDDDAQSILPNDDLTFLHIDDISFSLLELLQKKGVQFIFLDIGGVGENGKLLTPRKEIKDLLEYIHTYKNQHDLRITLIPYTSHEKSRIDFSQSDVRETYVEEIVYLHNIGFDGILVDVRSVISSQQDDYRDILKRLDSLIDNKMIFVFTEEGAREWGVYDYTF